MKRILVLAVDRDNDFGLKAGVVTPVIGIDGIKAAAMSLGAADPEDSDINCLFGAIKRYNDLLADDKNAEIALICGDQKIGHISDESIVEELEAVLDAVKPDSVMLVSDGSEDEFIYPIVSSRVPIDSVKRVYVKQAPGVEGFFYILSRFMRDSDKKRRFIAPLGWILAFIGGIFMVPNILMYLGTNDAEYIYTMTGSLAVLVIGLILVIYAYETWSWLQAKYRDTLSDFKSGNPKIIFTAIAIAFVICGLIAGILAARTVHDTSLFHKSLVFFSNFLWLFVFAVIFASLGSAVEIYVRTKVISRAYIIATITVLALAFLVQGVIDIINSAVGYAYAGEGMIMYELVVGIFLGFSATMLHAAFKSFAPKQAEDAESDAVQ